MSQQFPEYDFDEFHREQLPALIARGNGELASRAARGLKPLAIRVGEQAYTYRVDGAGFLVENGESGADTVVGMAHEYWQGLVNDLESAPGLLYGDLLESSDGDLMEFIRWEPALRALYSGIPPYDDVMSRLADRHGIPLAADAAYSLQNGDEEMTDFLQAAGYLLVKSVFSKAEIEVFRREADALRQQAREGDQISWWGKNDRGESVLTRVIRAGTQPTLHGLYDDPRISRLGALPPEDLRPWGADEVDGVTVIYKNPDMTEGLSDLPWHRDCGMGGHAVMCPQIIMSIYLYDATAERGELRFLPGSHRACVGFFQAEEPGAPQGVSVEARAGDVTLHYGDVMHAAPAPTGREGPFRQSVLLNFAPRYEHHRGGRHYNDVLLGGEGGQVEHLGQKVKRKD